MINSVRRIRFQDGAFACDLRELLQKKSNNAMTIGKFAFAAFDAKKHLTNLEARSAGMKYADLALTPVQRADQLII
jgi:hypothetical protein